jgi:uncharacterized protein GlcG (DUF336 family)
MAGTTHPPGPMAVVSLGAAQAAIAKVTAEATKRRVGVVVAIAAPSGDLVALARMDGVAMTWRSTESFAASLRGDLDTEPEYFHGMHHVGPLMTVGGGVPIIVDGHLAGVAAVSGGSTSDDIALADIAARTASKAMSTRSAKGR